LKDEIEKQDFGDLTEAEQREKDELLQEGGFRKWNKRDFSSFVKSCERHGRHNYALIAADLESKTKEEIKQYSDVFWKRYKEVPEYERIICNIEKGESKIKKRENRINLLKLKIESSKEPWSLETNYSSNKGKVYTKEEDIFLLLTTYQMGYGEWDKVREHIQECWQQKMAWFLKSRTPLELSRRVDQLIRLLEKDHENTVTTHKTSNTTTTTKTKKRKRSEEATTNTSNKKRKTSTKTNVKSK